MRLLAGQLGATRLALRLGHGFVATREHLAHGRIVVAAGDAFNIETAVVAALHLVVMKHHTGRLGAFAAGVRDVKAFDGQLVEILDRQVQHLGQGARARLLRAFFGQQPGQLNVGIFLRHLQPDAALLARLLNHGDAHAGLLGQQLHQPLLHGMADDERGRHGHADIVLGDEGLQHQLLHGPRLGCGIHLFLAGVDRRGIAQIRRKVRPVAQVATAAHHGQVHAGAAALHAHGQNVHILVVGGFDRLLVQHARQRRELVAHLGRLLELQPVGVRHHARFELLQQLAGFAAQHGLGIAHIQRIGFGRYQIHAGAGATLDLIEQTGAAAVGKHRVLAGAQPKDFLQQLNAFLDRPGTGIGAEVAVLLVHGAAVVGNARKLLKRRFALLAVTVGHAGYLEIGIAFVVPEQDVVFGVQRLDEIVFQQQRLGFGAHHRGLQTRDLADHMAYARAAMLLLEVAGNATLEVDGLAHVEQDTGSIEIAIDAGQWRQRGHLGQQFGGMRGRHGRYCLRMWTNPAASGSNDRAACRTSTKGATSA